MSMTLPDPLLWDDLENPPLDRGWSYTPPPEESATGCWQDNTVRTENGMWDSPAFPVEPFWWIRVRACVYAPNGSHFGVLFLDDNDELLAADHYSGIDGGDEWQTVDICVRAKAGAARALVRFNAMNGQPLWVNWIEVRPATIRSVAAWSKELAATIPPVTFSPPRSRWQHLATTRQFLAHDRTTRIVMLGDSNINDIGSSPFDARLYTVWPTCRIEVITAVGGGKGCGYYARENRVEEHVLAHEPHLLIIGGISNGEGIGPVNDVIEQVRAESKTEIMLMTGAFSEMDEERQRRARLWSRDLGNLAEVTQSAFLDLRHEWQEYLQDNGLDGSTLRRDRVHANERGRQWAAQILEQWFSP